MENLKAINNKSTTVLIVDDQISVREMLEEFLDVLNYSFVSAEDEETAILLAKELSDDISIVICDMMLGHQSGVEVFNKIAEIIPNATVIYTSGYAKEELEIETMGARPTLFLPKPFTFDKLQRLLREAQVS